MIFEEFWEEYQKIKKASSIIKEKHTQNKVFNHYINSHNIKHNINNFNNSSYSKQSVAKLLSNLDKYGCKRGMEYILKNAENPYLLNEENESISIEDTLKNWEKDFSNNANSKEAWHLMFSIKEKATKNNIEILQKSVDEVMKNNFFGYKYVMVTHTHQNNPHIHIILNKRNQITKKKIHFNSKDEIKEFWNDLRSDFAINLSYRGLKYHNQSILEQDLDKKYKKIQNSLYLDENNPKEELNNLLLNNIQNETQKGENKKSKIDILVDDLKDLNKQRDDLIILINQYKKKSNKRFYKFAKDLKEVNIKIKANESLIKQEIKELNSIQNRLNVLNKELNSYTYQNIDLLKKQKQFCDLFISAKNKTKSDYLNYQKIKKSIDKNTLDNLIKRSIESKEIQAKLFNKDTNIFKLQSYLKELDTNIDLLKKSNAELNEYESYLKRLENNKIFIEKIIKDRFNHIKQEISKNRNINLNSFIVKEYQKGCECLNQKDDLNITFKASKISKANENKNIKQI